MARAPANTSGSFAFKHYNIRTFLRGGKASARAYVGDEPTRIVANANSVEECVRVIERQLAAQDETRLAARQGGVPTADEYGDAFAVLGQKVRKHHWKMLLAHFGAPSATVTAAELAEAAGYPRYQAANLHYGALGRMVAEQLAFEPPVEVDGTRNWIATLADGRTNRSDDPAEWRWTLREEVADFLRTRGPKRPCRCQRPTDRRYVRRRAVPPA